MNIWTCAACGTQSETERCIVCGGETPAREEPPERPFEIPVPAFEPRRRSATPPRSRASGTYSWVAGVVMVLILLGAVAVKFRGDRPVEATPGTGTPTGNPVTTTYDGTTPSPTPDGGTGVAGPTAGPAGLVAIDHPAARAEEVAIMFETYFGGINARDPARALSVVAPTEHLDPSKPEDVAAFGRAIATTQDDDIRLGTVSDRGSTMTARLTFHSHQDPGYGPKDDPDQTCTAWTMLYTLTDDAGGVRIRSVKASHRSC
jgi:hypothetical protein